ncbi:SUR7/PalI family-domain-containing protein [Podospora conica]|nr:SUR7/PalI family-domain-containing protein [Schizothecium conicum]
MGFPSILDGIRKRTSAEKPPTPDNGDTAGAKESRAPSSTDGTLVSIDEPSTLTQQNVKKATKVRKGFAISASVSSFLSLIFLILVLIGNVYPRAVLRDLYFFKLDLADIIPNSVPNAGLINSIAQSIGLHDFYQVGLWNFCEGYENVGITFCSPPKALYWFNPVEILMAELLSGATIALPNEVITILDVLRIASNIMFGFFLTSACLATILVFLSPFALRSRWWSLPLAILSGLNSIFVGAACVVGSVISIVFKYAATAQSDLNIHAAVGVPMFVLMWMASGFALWTFIAHAGMGCCCVSRRDLMTGRRQVRNGVVQMSR